MSDRATIRDCVAGLSQQQRKWLAARLNDRTQLAAPTDQSELVAWIVAEADTVDEVTLRQELNRRLPSRLVPRRIIPTDQIPRTESGKVDRKRLPNTTHLETPSVASSGVRWSDSERTLVNICESLLRVRGVTPGDNFFHIGGDSLLSIRMISIARERGLEIEPRDVLAASSLAELAAAADRRSAANTIGPDCEHNSPVITKVRSGIDLGSVLLVHEVGGRCHYAHYLAADLDPRRTLYVSNQPEIQNSPRSIETLAELYVDAWMRAEPAGPKIIVAFCWGGLLGYEIARQLQRRGIDPDAVLIVESGTEASYEHATHWNRRFDRFKGLVVRGRNRIKTLRSGKAIGELIKTLVGKLRGQGAAEVTADAGFQFRDDEGDPHQIRMNVQAFLDYEIQPSELDLDLFRVGGPVGLIGTRYSDASLGWRYVVGSHLRRHSIPGTHDSCMQPPNVEKLAAALNRVISGRREVARTGDIDGVS